MKQSARANTHVWGVSREWANHQRFISPWTLNEPLYMSSRVHFSIHPPQTQNVELRSEFVSTFRFPDRLQAGVPITRGISLWSRLALSFLHLECFICIIVMIHTCQVLPDTHISDLALKHAEFCWFRCLYQLTRENPQSSSGLRLLKKGLGFVSYKYICF